MLSKFLKSRRAAPAARPEIPPGQRVYAIGDIHGRLDLLDDLLARIAADEAARGPSETMLVFLGDLIDRGPDSAGVVDRIRLLAADRSGVRILMGNHEEVFLTALGDDPAALRFFCRIGGRETLLSYGIGKEEYERLDYPELAARLSAAVPPEHVAFLTGFEDVVTVGGYVFVHAGLRPAIPIAEQRQSDLRWIRESFLDHRGAFEAFVVHGHTILADVDERDNRIGIDTGAYATGKLTALGLQGAERWVLQTS